MRLRALARSVVVAWLCTALVPQAFAYRRLLEYKDRLVKPAFAIVAGVGTYDPESASGSSNLQLNAGLRYLRADHDDDYHSLGFEVGVSSWSSSSADIFATYAEAMYFWPRTDAFSFDHHFFAGAGLGSAEVDRAIGSTLNVGMGFFEGGLQGRVRDWFLELRVKVIGGGGGAFDVSGFAPSLSAAYHFDI